MLVRPVGQGACDRSQSRGKSSSEEPGPAGACRRWSGRADPRGATTYSSCAATICGPRWCALDLAAGGVTVGGVSASTLSYTHVSLYLREGEEPALWHHFGYDRVPARADW